MNFDELAANLRGDLLTANSAEYDDTRAVYNAMIDKKPSAIAMCVDAADVQTCVNFARDNDLPLAIRSGGHNAGGLGSVDDGLVVDLSKMRGIRVDPRPRPCAFRPAAVGAMSTTPRTRTAWRFRPGSSRPPAAAASPWAAVSVI